MQARWTSMKLEEYATNCKGSSVFAASHKKNQAQCEQSERLYDRWLGEDTSAELT
jgi:hypothetical protein